MCKHLGKQADEVVAFGDGTNDIPMLKFAGSGVAVANAKPAVKQSANVVSSFTNNEDAVALELLRLHGQGFFGDGEAQLLPPGGAGH